MTQNICNSVQITQNICNSVHITQNIGKMYAIVFIELKIYLLFIKFNSDLNSSTYMTANRKKLMEMPFSMDNTQKYYQQ